LSNVAAGGYVLHGRGSSVVKVDADNRATDANLTVDDIRAAVKAAQARGNQ
jgi:hypothetical protein